MDTVERPVDAFLPSGRGMLMVMGGFGSGFRAGYSYRPVVEEALKVSAGECARTIPIAFRVAGAAFPVGVLIAGTRFEVVLEMVPAGLFPIPCWRCPRCQTRRHALYRHPARENILLCRRCHNLSYLSHRDRGRSDQTPRGLAALGLAMGL